MKPTTLDAYNLLHRGAIALAEIEANGMRVDVPYLKDQLKKIGRKISRNERSLISSDIGKAWRKRFRDQYTFGSREQLGKILFDEMGMECKERTKTGRPKMDQGTLEKLDVPFVKKYLETESLKKLRAPYLKGILRETVDGIVHPFFNLHLARTFRSSSDSPNFQNLPIRNPVQGGIIRRGFIARPGRRIVEVDYSGIEVRIAACYHKDPLMLEYIRNPKKDMHRDMAAECFRLREDEVSKEVRYCGKNMFVFPQFYGSWYPECARNLWDAVDGMDLKKPDGMTIREHLEREGIRKRGRCDKSTKPSPGTFEHHIMEVERRFWGERFKRYNNWKKEWVDDYLEDGGFTTLTGFRIDGVMGRNDVINYPVQGSAFHCLLWSLIRLQESIKKRKMKTLIVGQIHDSIIADVPAEEFQRYLKLARRVMTEDLCREWNWINVPLDIEAEASGIDGNWFEKKEVKIGG